jgi:hypothetical protein
MSSITLDEWLAAISNATESQPDDGFTSDELAELLGISRSLAVKRLGEAIRAGRVYCAGRRRITRIDGVKGRIPIYKTKEVQNE